MTVTALLDGYLGRAGRLARRTDGPAIAEPIALAIVRVLELRPIEPRAAIRPDPAR